MNKFEKKILTEELELKINNVRTRFNKLIETERKIYYREYPFNEDVEIEYINLLHARINTSMKEIKFWSKILNNQLNKLNKRKFNLYEELKKISNINISKYEKQCEVDYCDNIIIWGKSEKEPRYCEYCNLKENQQVHIDGHISHSNEDFDAYVQKTTYGRFTKYI
jgi:hypothetical protein